MRSLNILLFEHNPYQLLAMHQQLNACGVFRVLTADSREQASDLLERRGAQDILICDLPANDEASLRWLEQAHELREFRALIIHSNGLRCQLEQVAQHARRLGVKVLGCLQKPSSPPALRKLLESYIPAALPLPQVAELANCRDLQTPSSTLCLQAFLR